MPEIGDSRPAPKSEKTTQQEPKAEQNKESSSANDVGAESASHLAKVTTTAATGRQAISLSVRL